MRTSNHAHMRMRQRSIRPSLVDLALREGVPLAGNPDRLLLGRQHVHSLWVEGALDRKTYLRLEQATPIVLVFKDNRLVTVFRPNRGVNRSRPRWPNHSRHKRRTRIPLGGGSR